MDILNLHFSEFDEDKPDQTKAVIRAFFAANSNFSDRAIDDLVDLVFLSYQQGYSAGYASGSDYAAGYFDDGGYD